MPAQWPLAMVTQQWPGCTHLADGLGMARCRLRLGVRVDPPGSGHSTKCKTGCWLNVQGRLQRFNLLLQPGLLIEIHGTVSC